MLRVLHAQVMWLGPEEGEDFCRAVRTSPWTHGPSPSLGHGKEPAATHGEGREEEQRGHVQHTNQWGASAKTETSQGEKTPHVRSRSTLVLPEMKQLLLLLQEGKKLKFCSSVQRNHKNKKSVYRGGEQSRGEDFNSSEYTSLGTLLSQKNTCFTPTVVLVQSSSFLQLFIWKMINFFLMDNFANSFRYI